jgi:pimeloyl-ACP methyl ester carboxylesterase
VLVVQGQHDEYATDRHAIDIDAALPNSELWLIPDCGHTPHAALGDAFNRRAAGFFARHLAAPDTQQGSV